MSKRLVTATLFAALYAAGLSASAADVDLYGLMDIGLKSTKSSGEAATFEMNSGQINGSRFGLRAKETISPDLKVYVNLENGFDADTGTLGDEDRLFNRNAVLGLDTPYGQFEFGRTGTLVSGNTGGIFAGRVSPFGITWQELQDSQVLSGAVGSRIDNGIRYESPNFAGLRLYAQASNGMDGDDALPSAEKDRYAAVGATWRYGPVMAVLVVDRTFTRNRSESDAFLGDDYTTVNLGGTYDFGSVKVFAGYQYGNGVTRVGKLTSSVKGEWNDKDQEDRTGFDTQGFVLGADVELWGGHLKMAGGYAKGDRDWKVWRNDGSLRYTKDQDVEGYQFALGYLYPLSKRTDIYAGGAYIHSKDINDSTQWKTTGEVMNRSHDGKNENTRSFILGLRHKF